MVGMARPLRLERAGAWYHITGQGLERRDIFADTQDCAHWLELLGQAVELWRLVVHGYALMGNHFHLLLETGEANLSRMMHRLNTRSPRRDQGRGGSSERHSVGNFSTLRCGLGEGLGALPWPAGGVDYAAIKRFES